MSSGDPNGKKNALQAIEKINNVYIDCDKISNDILSCKNLLIDASGMLTTKVAGGLDEISLSILNLKKMKNNLINAISSEGDELYRKYCNSRINAIHSYEFHNAPRDNTARLNQLKENSKNNTFLN